MQAAWGYDDNGQFVTSPMEQRASIPGSRLQDMREQDIRDPKIPDGSLMDIHLLQRELGQMRKYAQEKELNMTYTFQGCSLSASGTMPKARFKTALGILFHQFPLSEEVIAAIAYRYGCGAPDVHSGGYMEVMWRAFVIELRKFDLPPAHELPDPFDKLIVNLMSELHQMANDQGLNMAHSFQGAGGLPTGVISKQKFFMTITGLLFPKFFFTQKQLSDLAEIYANKSGPPDIRLGGYQEVLWRQFIIDVRKVPVPEDKFDY